MTHRDESRALVPALLLCCGLLATTPQTWAQAGDAPGYEQLDVIELPDEQPEQGGLRLNWGCDVLLIEDSHRFRPGYCADPDEHQNAEGATEITLEHADDDGYKRAIDRKRKLIY